MAISTFTIAPDNSQAPWNNLWKALSQAFAAVGMTQTADTGQVDWNVLQTVPAANTWATPGIYEMWRFASGTLQTEMPIFIRVQYGVTSGPAIRISIGTGTDGAGNLTGNISSVFTMGTATPTTTTSQCWVSAAANRLQFALWTNHPTANNGIAFSVSRSVTSAGVYNSDGVTILGFGNGVKFQQWLPKITGGSRFPFAGTTVFISGNPPTGTGNAGVDFGVYPIYPFRGSLDYFDGAAMVVAPTDISLGSVFSVSIYGVTQNYLVAGNAASGHPNSNGNTAFTAIGLRYE
jgi:hypothetical protein